MFKRCCKCKVLKTVNNFSPNKKGGKYSVHSRCKACCREVFSDFVSTPEGKRINKDRQYRNKYGISLETYEAMVEECGNRCYICGLHPGSRMLVVDHDHQTGRVRGLLCHTCNSAIGLVAEDVETLEAMISYINHYRS